MVRCVVMSVVLVGAVCVAFADDTDPVKEKLFAAKIAYDAEMTKFRTLVGEWLDEREDAARKDGNKAIVDQIKAERKAFDDSGELPKGLPSSIQQKSTQARKTIESAYSQAVKDYTKGKKDTEAEAVEVEWKKFGKTRGIDLLALVNPKTHAIAGEWKKEGTALVVNNPAADKAVLLMLPYQPGEEYDVELTFQRVKGDESISIGLVAGKNHVAALVDAFPGRGSYTGFEYVDMKQVLANGTGVKGPILTNGTECTFTCSVRAGKIDLLINEKAVTSFKGDFTRLSLYSEYRLPNEKALSLVVGAKCTYQIARIAVIPVKGKGTILK